MVGLIFLDVVSHMLLQANLIKIGLMLWYGMQSMLRIGLILTFIAGMMLIITNYIFGISFIGVAIPIILLYFGSGFVWPNAFAIAFTPFGHIAGYANSIYSFMQLCGGALLSNLVLL
ncbi:MAG: hypothetical protein LW807_01560 [Proteobacteria bacterium]|nr:hypothetical protein [Pseudomonadota bacterium]